MVDGEDAAPGVEPLEMRSGEPGASNQMAFREANEAIEASRRRLGVGGRVPYLCECEAAECRELLPLTQDEYRRARETPRRFVVVRGHTVREAAVVEETEGYMIVEQRRETTPP